MRQTRWMAFVLPIATLCAQTREGNDILAKVGRTKFSERRILTMRMIIHGERGTRTVTAKSWQR